MHAKKRPFLHTQYECVDGKDLLASDNGRYIILIGQPEAALEVGRIGLYDILVRRPKYVTMCSTIWTSQGRSVHEHWHHEERAHCPSAQADTARDDRRAKFGRADGVTDGDVAVS